MVTLQVIDDFYPDPQLVRDFALEHDFSQGTVMHGHLYPGTVVPYQPFIAWFIQRLAQTVGAVDVKGTAFVSAKSGEYTEQWIHADTICAKWAAVIYLFDGHHQHGTALWRHRASGCAAQDHEFYDKLGVNIADRSQVQALVDRVKSESNSEEFWQCAGFTEARFNRLIIYPAKHFHSRYPREAFGDSPETGRLVQVCFFD